MLFNCNTYLFFTNHFISLLKLWKRLFTTIGYADTESAGPQTHPDFEIESQWFRVQLKKAGFLNPYKDNRYFESLDGYNKLSEEMKSFSITAQAQHINYIKEKLSLTKPLLTRSIPVTIDEMQIQSAEGSVKEELILVIESLIETLIKTN